MAFSIFLLNFGTVFTNTQFSFYLLKEGFIMNQNFVELPKAVEMEKYVLSAMLLKDGLVIPKVASILVPDDFFYPEHKIIYRSILQLYSQGAPTDILSISELLRKSGELDKIGGITYLFLLGDIAFTTAYAESHSHTIKEKANLRKLIETAEFIIDDAQQGIKSISDIIFDYQKILDDLSSSNEPSKSLQLAPYFKDSLKSDIENMKRYANRSTGFSNIDYNQFFSPGLYVIGATPATGKTTFCWQLLEQLANNGEKCIYCSYEMSGLELFTKTAARRLFLKDKLTSLTAAEIRRGGWSNELDNIISEVADSNANLQLLELQDESVDDLLKLLKPLCQEAEKAPVVCIDYLQIIPHSKDNIKAGIDDTVRKLKKFQRDTNTTFIVISSFNRTNYSQSVAFESFKESGNIEYTADVVWGLQLNVMNKTFNRDEIDKAKKQQPRQIQLKCLKNRQGTNYDCFFNYFSAHDYFEPCDGFDDYAHTSNNYASNIPTEGRIKNGKLG